MIEQIKLSQLTKNYIDNHVVECEGVQCVYREWWDVFTGSTQFAYLVLNSPLDVRHYTIKDLKNYIKEQRSKA